MNKTARQYPAPVKQVALRDDFWAHYQQLLREVVIPYQWEALNDRIPGAEPSRCIHNLRVAAGEEEGEYEGPVFQDHGIVTWLEAVGGSLAVHLDPELERLADEAVELLSRVQREDGYLNSYFIVKEPDKRWTNLMEGHELFCAGHLIEAAVAYSGVTGKPRFLDIARQYADYIDSVFGPDEGKHKGCPGHQEIELALLKLHRATGEERYLRLARFFLDQRGGEPNYFLAELAAREGRSHFPDAGGFMTLEYLQAHKPVREQREAVGHAVRAVYQYAAMAELAAEAGDNGLAEACHALFESIAGRQMYVTGGIGSTHIGEAFTLDYDLPNDTIYQETCASIGLVFFASRMLLLRRSAVYADVMELALYNSVLSGISRDGTHFFYVNPLEVWPQACERNPDRAHVKPVRQKWFGCACCPPNIARTLAAMGQYIYSSGDSGIDVHLYIGSEAELEVGGCTVRLTQRERYQRDGISELTLGLERPLEFNLCLRKPGWCDHMEVLLNGAPVDCREEDGYLVIQRVWSDRDRLDIRFGMEVRALRAHPRVRADAGKIALQRGPMVYCLEQVDNGENLPAISIPPEQEFGQAYVPDLLGGCTVITGRAYRLDETAWEGRPLYAPVHCETETTFRAVPYALWGNRDPGEMVVWVCAHP